MIWIAAWVIVALAYGYISHEKPHHYYYRTNFGKGFFTALCAGLVPFLLASLVTGIFMSTPSVPYERTESTRLTAVTDNTELSGVFVLGSGGIGSSSRYRYYYEGEHGITYDVMRPTQMSQRRVFFDLRESANPRLEVYQPTQWFSMTPWAIHWHRLSKWKFSIPKDGYKVKTEIDGG